MRRANVLKTFFPLLTTNRKKSDIIVLNTMQKLDFRKAMKEWYQFILPLWEKIQSLISNKKILILIIGCAAGIVLLISLLVISVRMNHNRNETQRILQEENQIFEPKAIKQADLFLPEEPDFIPEIILDREPRSVWTDEDAALFWNDPLNENSDAWKNRIFKAVDDMMETIP
jgi:hypothetical protein